ncbi:uncharacterized protein LOC135195253 [Macrobrachium nipponense]|uniref:uncharacterized protein LOC135195253 n=1 Tax=Macrobrachium nipponense TaxID=159736 RepID=UPI0030C83CBA
MEPTKIHSRFPSPKNPTPTDPSLSSVAQRRTAERMVLNRLLWKTGPLHHRLYAYKEGIGTQECLADVMSTINERKAIVVFLDLEKAYELASAAAILEALADKAVKGNLLAWAKGYTQNRQARVTFQGASSDFLSLENGTPQGGILSPFLFNVLMEKLATTTLPNGVEIFIYADDVCLVS